MRHSHWLVQTTTAKISILNAVIFLQQLMPELSIKTLIVSFVMMSFYLS